MIHNISVFANDFSIVFLDKWLCFVLREIVLYDQEASVDALKIIYSCR